MAVALDQQFVIEKKGIKEEKVPVLNATNMEQHYFVTYIPLPRRTDDQALIEQWLERMLFIGEDLKWLLEQNHTKFWCEAAFNKDFHSMFDSYLRYAPRPQRSIPMNNYMSIPNGKQIEDDVSRLMFLCILRLSTYKESTEHFFTPEGFGRIIYDNFIFDIPRIFDICSIYALNNKDLLTKMIENIFKQQQGYTRDLIEAIKSIQDVISKREQIFHTTTGPKKITKTTNQSSNIDEIYDLLYYILDLSCTINRFFSVYPEGRFIFYHEQFHLTLINFLETFLRAYERYSQSNNLSDHIEIFEEVKYETIILFNDLLTSCCVDPLIVNENKSENVELFINIISILITEKRFLSVYEDYFNLLETIDLVHQTTGLLDEQQMKFYTDAVKQAIELHGTPSCKRKLDVKNVSLSTASSTIKKRVNPDIQMIQDLFPHLSETYIEKCLKHYNNNTEQLVNALFDNTVPNSIESEPTIFSTDDKYENEDLPLLKQRSNIYDNDEFDLFNRNNVDLTRIHRGKKTRDAHEDLDDKSHLQGMHERYARLALVDDESDGEYDDEYDDTYDDGIINVKDKDDAIDKEIEKNQNRLLPVQSQHYRRQAGENDEEEDDDDDDGEGQDATKAKARRQFVENPEIVRERNAQRRAAWLQTHQPHRVHNEQTHDVVGSQRGRGQSTTVTHNRRWKDTHKASQANHNRRDRAAQKSNRGLLS